MDTQTFDAMTRRLSRHSGSRRQALRLAGRLLAGLAGVPVLEVAAAGGHGRSAGDRQDRGNASSGPQTTHAPKASHTRRAAGSDLTAEACLPGGKRCKKSAQCCSGLCKKKPGKKQGHCTTCTPNCTGRVCGDDGCGGLCGQCQTGQLCDNNGLCQGCPKDQKECRGTCIPASQCCSDGECSGGQLCVSGTCQCRASEVACHGVCQPECCPGATRACYGGPAGTAGQGICRMGTQTCQATGRWPSAGECPSQVTPRAETCNGQDDDCNGVIDNGAPCPGTKVCRDGGCCIPELHACSSDEDCCSGLSCDFWRSQTRLECGS
jgi:hypothetical protein